MTGDVFKAIVRSIEEIIDLKVDARYRKVIVPKIDSKFKEMTKLQMNLF